MNNHKKFAPKRIVNENELKKFIAKFRPIEENDIVIGVECIDSMHDIFVSFMELWTARLDYFLTEAAKKAKLLKKEGKGKMYLRLIPYRGCTFEEYAYLYRPVQEEYNDLYPAYEWFQIIDEEQRKDFIYGKSLDVDQYIKDLNEQYAKDFPNSSFVALDFFLDRVVATVPHKDLKMHAYVCGKSGSGKSELIKTIFYNIQSKGNPKNSNSLIVIDPHGDLVKELRAFRLNKKNFERLIYIDPTLKGGYMPTINPLQIKDRSWSSIEIMSQNLEGVFQELVDDTSLSRPMKTLLNPTISTLLWKGDASLQDLQRFLDDDRNSDLVELGKRSPYKEHRRFFETDFHNRIYLPSKASVRGKLQSLFNSSTFTNLVCGKNTIDLEHEMNEGKVILFNLAKGVGNKAMDAFGTLIVGLLSGFAQKRVMLPPSERKPTFLFIDECQNYMTESIIEILAEDRKYGLHLILANQYFNQIGKDWQEAIKNNTDVGVIGRSHPDNHKLLASSVGVTVDKLKSLPKFHFYIKSGDRTAIKIKSPTNLLGTRNKKFYLMDDELAKLDEQIIASSYYKKVEIIGTPNREEESENQDEQYQEGGRKFRFDDI